VLWYFFCLDLEVSTWLCHEECDFINHFLLCLMLQYLQCNASSILIPKTFISSPIHQTKLHPSTRIFPGLDGTDQWCFHCYHVGGECGQGLFYNLFYQADPVFWSALAAEPGAVRPMGVMVDGCRWLHENSVRVRGFPTVPGPCNDFVEEGKCKAREGSWEMEKMYEDVV